MLKYLIVFFSLVSITFSRPLPNETSNITAKAGVKNAPIYVFNYYLSLNNGLNLTNLDCTQFSHLIWAFANVLADGTVTLEAPPGTEFDNVAKATKGPLKSSTKNSAGIEGELGYIMGMKKSPKCKGLKTILSLGGWSWSHNFSVALSNPASTNVAIKTSLDLMKKYDFDGIDVDWEFPNFARDDALKGSNGASIPFTTNKDDYTNLLKFFKAFRAQTTKAPVLLTMAMRAINFEKGPIFKDIGKVIDFGFFMGYEYQNGQKRTWPTGALEVPTASAGCLSNPSSCAEKEKVILAQSKKFTTNEQEFTVSGGLKTYVKGDATTDFPIEKLVLGVPFYGLAYTVKNLPKVSEAGVLGVGYPLDSNGILAPKKIDYATSLKECGSKATYLTGLATYVCQNQTAILLFDGPKSMEDKVDFTIQQGMAGIMLWTSSQDVANENSLQAWIVKGRVLKKT